jgi:nucleoside 2-deoxyribosyltransferase
MFQKCDLGDRMKDKKTYKLYLAGGIDKSPDNGVSCRNRIIKAFKDVEYIRFINPCDFDYNDPNYPTMWEFQKNENHSLHQCITHHKKIADGDIEIVSSVDGVIIILNEVAGPGTSGEATVAKHKKIPTIGIFDKHISKNRKDWRKCSPWILSRVDSFFFSIQALKQYILENFKP